MTCFGVEILVKAEVPVEVTADLEPAPEAGPTMEPPTKVRKPRLAKHLQRPWTPRGLVSEN